MDKLKKVFFLSAAFIVALTGAACQNYSELNSNESDARSTLVSKDDAGLNISPAEDSAQTEQENYLSEITYLSGKSLLVCAPDSTSTTVEPAGDEDEKYSRLLDNFKSNYELYKLFGGAYMQNGYFHLLITDLSQKNSFTEIIGEEKTIISQCGYSYTYLKQLSDCIISAHYSEDKLNSIIIDYPENRVIVRTFDTDTKEEIVELINDKGYDINALDIAVSETAVANPA